MRRITFSLIRRGCIVSGPVSTVVLRECGGVEWREERRGEGGKSKDLEMSSELFCILRIIVTEALLMLFLLSGVVMLLHKDPSTPIPTTHSLLCLKQAH